MSIYEHYCKAYKVTTDSRCVEPDSVFFALKGENFDGNDFAMEVAERGVASLVVTDRQSLPDHPRIVKVDDSLKALQSLAAMHRKRMKDLTVIAITGTNGKTTTKELVSAVLSKKYPLIHTEGNLNNHIGVPRTLLRITPETRIAVVEMGANHPGEIKQLVDIVEPDYGIITNIGKAHLEGFGSFEGVIKTKNELYVNLREHHKKAFVNSDNELLMSLVGSMDHYTYGKGAQADCMVSPESCDPYLKVFNTRLGSVQTQLVGAYNFENVAAAIAAGMYFGVADDDIREALESYRPTNSRSQVIDGRNHIIMDAYNANPTSMNAAITNFRSICGERPMLILGDMRELGDASEKEHRAILSLLWESGFRQVHLVGPCFSQYNNHPEYHTYPNVDELVAYLEGHPVEGQSILVKGSRGIRLEKALPLIQ
ncbi:MAG: UDP-N-acetylmuramoyl-tripeptide--D-alanyl-D-alanine ligase [Bacteroidales bacterium]|nr:UDP-N-acetylmuramoyl-tripeptide--D-alanyl-D-alanine ligase [Bacteroidales bacterium]